MASPRPTATCLKRLFTALRSVRVREVGLDEVELHKHISQALTQAGIAHRREYAFAPRCRADFWIEPGIVIEVKKRRPDRAKLTVQLTRYAQVPTVRYLVVMLEKSISLEPVLEGVPVRVVSMNAAWGVAV